MRRRVTQRDNFFALLAVFALCLAQQACGAGRRPEAAQELIIGTRADDYVIEPLKSRLGMYPLNVNVCEPLARLTADYGIEPLLAERWERRGDNTWRFFLRPGVVFSNGQPLTSEAVKWTVERAVKGEAQHTFLGENSVRVVDELTVDITPTQPSLRLLEQLVHPNYSIIAPGSEPALELICTGPFKLTEHRRGERIVVERNERYWGTPASLAKLTFRFLHDDMTRVLSFQAGELDVILDAPREQAAALRAQDKTRVMASPVGRVAALFLNIHGQPPHELLSDRNLRRAVGLAIDRRALVEKVWEGNGEVISTLAPPVILGAHARLVRGFDFDPRRSAELLAHQGWTPGPDGVRARAGRRLSLTMLAWPEMDAATLEFVQAQLAVVGIEARIVRSPDTASYQARLYAGEFDLDLEATNQNDANPIFLPALRFYSKAPGRAVRYFAPGGRFDEHVEAGLAATERDEVSLHSAEAMRVLIDEEAVVIPLAGLPRITALRDDVRGFIPHPSLLNQRWDTLRVER